MHDRSGCQHNPLARKLAKFAPLSAEDSAALEAVVGRRVQRLRPRQDIIREGERPDYLNIVLDGWACRHKSLEDGRRQIFNVFLPGDLCDLHVYMLDVMDHNITALTPLTFAQVTRTEFDALADVSPRIVHAFWQDALVSSAIYREWIINIGQRTSFERMAHLMCELHHRLSAVGLCVGESCDFPLTQIDLADAAGMTSVHANRVIQELRAHGLIRLEGRRLTILDLDALESAAMFDPNYLHRLAQRREPLRDQKAMRRCRDRTPPRPGRTVSARWRRACARSTGTGRALVQPRPGRRA